MSEKPIFKGVSQVTIDAKGRMAMPSKYRHLLQSYCKGELVITADRDECLLIYPKLIWLMLRLNWFNYPGLINRLGLFRE